MKLANELKSRFDEMKNEVTDIIKSNKDTMKHSNNNSDDLRQYNFDSNSTFNNYIDDYPAIEDM